MCSLNCFSNKAAYPHVKNIARIWDCLAVCLRISATAAHMETDSNHIQPELLRPLQQQPTAL